MRTVPLAVSLPPLWGKVRMGGMLIGLCPVSDRLERVKADRNHLTEVILFRG